MVPICKNIIIKHLYAAAVLLIFTVACGKKGGEAESGGKIVLTSFYPVYIAALNVTENIPNLRLVNMAPPAAGCLHDYQLTAADAANLEKASVLIVNGGGMESFLEKAVSLNTELMIIDASEDVEFISGYDYNGHNHHDNEDNDIDGDVHVNSHVWMSIDNYIQQIKTVAARLSAWDSANGNGYEKNAQSFITSLRELKTEANEKLSGISDKKIAIFHEGFVYLAREFGLTVAAVFEQEHGTEPSAAEIISEINAIKKAGVTALFTDPQQTSAAAKTISAETDLPLFTLDPIVSGSMTKDSYVSAMRKNIDTLKKALEQI